MEDVPDTTLLASVAASPLRAFDPSTVSAEALAELFPELGLFPAEDILGWRTKNDAFPDQETLVSALGIDRELAARIAEGALCPAAPPDPVEAEVEAANPVDSTDAEPADLVDATDIVDTGDETLAVAVAVSEASLPVSEPLAPSEPPARATPPSLPVERMATSASVEPPSRSSAPEPHDAVVAHEAVVAAPRPARSRSRLAIGAIVALNAVVIAGAVRLHLEMKRTRAPIAAMSATVTELQAEQSGDRARLEETRAQLDETRIRLDEQAKAIAATQERQKDAERHAREHEAQEAKDLAALNARMSTSERRTYELDEAVKLIDMVQGRASPPAH